MELLEIDFYEKNENEFYCAGCDFKCSYLSDWTRHNSTRKHLSNHNGTKIDINGTKIGEKNEKTNKCATCEKIYKTPAGLWKHKRNGCSTNACSIDSEIISDEQKNKKVDTIIDQNTILSILKQNNELQKLLIEQNKTIIELSKNNQITNNTTNNTNSHNKAFNLQFFLNETCKDAMNIMDFVESIQLQLSDLEKVGEIGYVEGISNIIVKNLNALDVTQRPVHCTDKKRETIYIKDDDKWEKDDEKSKIRKVIKKVATKNARLIQKFKEKHPDYNEYHSNYSTQYHKLIIESFGGSGDNDVEKEDKIIRNITKNIVVDKGL
jgi:Txe/YoeB family toxin of Txe-Axe toxin-antitoxin module